ncbi:uncharacterized protein ACRADG_007159 [Cochliomyia hominivorax]
MYNPLDYDDDLMLAIVTVCLKQQQKQQQVEKRKRVCLKEEFKKRLKFTSDIIYKELDSCKINDVLYIFKLNNHDIYNDLKNLLGPLIQKQDIDKYKDITVDLYLWLTLRYLITGCKIQELEMEYKVPAKIIAQIILEVCEIIKTKLKDFFKLPCSPQEWLVHAADSYEKWQFPNCLGLIGGLNLSINKNDSKEDYLLLTITNAKQEFLLADITLPGTSTNILALEKFKFGLALLENCLPIPPPFKALQSDLSLPYVFLSNEALTLQENLLTPFPGNRLSQKQKTFNDHLLTTYRSHEKSQHFLLSQFRVLKSPLDWPAEEAKIIISACFYFYNYLRRKTPQILWEKRFNGEEEGLTFTAKTENAKGSLAAQEVRSNFMEYFNK